jgi:hypothetical protein
MAKSMQKVALSLTKFGIAKSQNRALAQRVDTGNFGTNYLLIYSSNDYDP